MAGFQLGITKSGMELLAKGISGREICFVAVLMGDGSYSGSVSDAAAVISEKVRLPISRIVCKSGQVTVKGVLRFGAVEEGFVWREVGLAALDPDTGEEVLYAYGTGGSDYIPGAAEATLDERSVQLTVLVSEAANITAELDPTAIYVDEKMLEEAIGRAVVPLVHGKSGTVHALAGLSGRSGLVSCSFTAADEYVKGDAFTVDGEAYTLQMQDGSEADDGLFIAGAAVALLIDTEGKTVNFKAGGGVKLPALTNPATAAQIMAGYEAIDGEGRLLTGTASRYTVKTGSLSLSSGTKSVAFTGTLVCAAVYATISDVAQNVSLVPANTSWVYSYQDDGGNPYRARVNGSQIDVYAKSSPSVKYIIVTKQ